MAIPEKIGRYEIKGELGRGGFATVYRAYDPRFEREVAIKFLPSELMHSDPQFRMRFQREAKIIAQLEHPSIVPVYDVGAENEQPYFVMRYMSGGSLSERIKARTYTIEEAVKIIENLAPGLDEAHAKGIVHRDLKPANILFTEKNVPLISDFGIAKFTQGDSTVDNMTGSAIIGTPAYMAPEQASGEAVDGRVDIYAMGVILYEMVTGKQPYTADTPLGLAIKHVTEPVPRILEANPNLPTWMQKVISTAMAKNPEDRFSSAVELVETIKAFLRGENPEIHANVTKKMSPYNSTATFKRTKTEEPKRRNWIVPVVVLVGLIAVVGVGAFAVVGSGMLQSLFEPVATPTIAAAVTIPPLVTEVAETSEAITPTVEAAPTESVPSLPLIGGADKIAFIKNNDIWVMNVDGSELKQHTTDGLPKFNLQWLPNGTDILYMTGKTVKTVNIDTEVEEVLMNFVSAEYFEGFSVSPDGKQVAMSINRELFIVPFDVEKLRAATRKSALLDMKGCFYNDLAVKELQWSDDSTKLSVEFIANSNGSFADAIRVYDVQDCKKLSSSKIDEFPAGRFQFSGDLSSFDWDGDLLFFLTSNVRNGGFGDLALYNIFTHKAEKAAPYESNCCYRDAAFSPDGSQVIFAFQDIRLGGTSPINLYIIPADSISTARTIEPILPMDFFTKRDEAPQPVMRPVQP